MLKLPNWLRSFFPRKEEKEFDFDREFRKMWRGAHPRSVIFSRADQEARWPARKQSAPKHTVNARPAAKSKTHKSRL